MLYEAAALVLYGRLLCSLELSSAKWMLRGERGSQPQKMLTRQVPGGYAKGHGVPTGDAVELG